MAYVYMGEETDANLVGSLFRRLPEFGSGEMAAPLVITDANLDITNVTFMNNQAAYRSGAMIVSGSSNVDLLNVRSHSTAREMKRVRSVVYLFWQRRRRRGITCDGICTR